jgi:glycosyltransferase involved in cell wall biosynthesis
MLSVAMITFNEEKKLPITLAAVKDLADEIIIVDSHSTDSTREIAVKYGAQVFEEDWKGFGRQKNSAVKKCGGEWILLLDADEELTVRLKDEIMEIIRNPFFDVYEIPRIAYTFGYRTRRKDYTVRLVKKGSGHYDDKEVHESWIHGDRTGRLDNPLRHHTYLSYHEYFEKFNRYTEAAAREKLKKGKNVTLLFMICNAAVNFIKEYIFRGAILDGRQGFINSAFGAFYTFVKYVRLDDMIRRGDVKNHTNL